MTGPFQSTPHQFLLKSFFHVKLHSPFGQSSLIRSLHSHKGRSVILKGIFDVKHGRHIAFSIVTYNDCVVIVLHPRYAWHPHATIAFSQANLITSNVNIHVANVTRNHWT